jgi:hypothetical protein
MVEPIPPTRRSAKSGLLPSERIARHFFFSQGIVFTAAILLTEALG